MVGITTVAQLVLGACHVVTAAGLTEAAPAGSDWDEERRQLRLAGGA